MSAASHANTQPSTLPASGGTVTRGTQVAASSTSPSTLASGAAPASAGGAASETSPSVTNSGGAPTFTNSTFAGTAGGAPSLTSSIATATGGSGLSTVTSNTDAGLSLQLVVPRTHHAATLLLNGNVLVTGGSRLCGLQTSATESAEIYRATSSTLAAGPSMKFSRLHHTSTLLGTGKVLIAGGTDSTSVELFDPDTETFVMAGSMNVPRAHHTATRLDSGKVLIAGGSSNGEGTATAELYDPASGEFTLTHPMTEPRYQHAATLLENGKVLLLGGYVAPKSTFNNEGLQSAELYDPATGEFVPTGSMHYPRVLPTTTLLPNGSVLVSGGHNGFEGYFASAALELYDASSGNFTTTGPLTVARTAHTATLVDASTVLFTGGYQGGGAFANYLDSTDACGITPATCKAGKRLTVQREFHTATRLHDGGVLIMGGDARGGCVGRAEIYRE